MSFFARILVCFLFSISLLTSTQYHAKAALPFNTSELFENIFQNTTPLPSEIKSTDDTQEISPKQESSAQVIHTLQQKDIFALLQTIQEEDSTSLQKFRQLGTDINIVDEEGKTVFIHMAEKGDFHALQILLKHPSINKAWQDNHGNSALYYAAKNNHTHCLHALLANNAFIENQNLETETPLLIAIKNGHEKCVHLLLAYGAKIDTQDNQGISPLIYALQTNNKELCKLILNVAKNDEDLKHKIMRMPNKAGATPLQIAFELTYFEDKNYQNLLALLLQETGDEYIHCTYAADLNNVQILDILLKNASAQNLSIIDEKNAEGDTALLLACKKEYFDMVKILLHYGADASIRDASNNTALMIANHNQNREIIDALLAYGANIEERDENNYTPLMIASLNNDVDTIEALIALNATIDATREGNWTAFMMACLNNNEDAALALLDCGANMEAQDEKGASALLLSIRNKKALDFLLKHNANIEDTNRDGQNALMLASSYNDNEILKTLLNEKPNLEIKDARGYTALMFAAEENAYESINLLLEHGAKLDVRNNGDMTPLMVACRNQSFQSSEYLLHHGVDVNAKDANKLTALHYISAMHKPHAFIKLLLENGADIEAQDCNNMTPLMYAKAHNQPREVIELLLPKDLHKATLNNIDNSTNDNEQRTSMLEDFDKEEHSYLHDLFIETVLNTMKRNINNVTVLYPHQYIYFFTGHGDERQTNTYLLYFDHNKNKRIVKTDTKGAFTIIHSNVDEKVQAMCMPELAQ